MLIPSFCVGMFGFPSSLSRRVNANSQLSSDYPSWNYKLIKKGEC